MSDTTPSSVTLLFPNAQRREVDLDLFEHKGVDGITVEEVMHHIFDTTVPQAEAPADDKELTTTNSNDQTTVTAEEPAITKEPGVWQGGDVPESWQQIRLIHMGAALQPSTKLAHLRLDLSDIIHVSCRPLILEEEKPKALKKRLRSISSFAGALNRSHTTETNTNTNVNANTSTARGERTTTNDANNEINQASTGGSSCCVIC